MMNCYLENLLLLSLITRKREREREKRNNHVFTFSQLLKKKNALFFTLYYTLMRTKMKEKNEFSRHIISIINTLII